MQKKRAAMGSIQPTGKQIQELAGSADEGPVVMVNMLRFREKTDAGETGRAAYERYGRAVAPILNEIGAKVLWLGAVRQVFIGAEKDRWDEVLLVEYPSRKAFLSMISRPDYKKIHKYREDALEDSALLATSSLLPPGR
ncbi:MAG TPA: DUF1330 domain-containing protein [Spirochaetota bacterium]|mgnify:CR=1 FL=1|nr:DUF1330 domain-containing protein [Spirochaetota bacterium]HPC41438.1 DUF1330 domain-containing protein [Spirochaetota bacterium]HPL18122.1 DUF1330 domain-containing protein [Spirochaetota bacterium]HQF09179.1 DUF1330 domain-containing protein [Spirochaetota bacterium]HQH97721.1 DUF1330 domain-containing protein [Spirochaetota bacterium]